MKEGDYWIQHKGIGQVAYYIHDKAEDIDTGKKVTGFWRLTEGFDICHDADVEVVGGLIAPRAS